MVLFFYNLALFVVLVAGSPWWLWRMATTRKYREGLRQRSGAVGRLPRANHRPLIWIHAVSVGEVLAVSRFVKALDTALPEYSIAISTTTRTGQALARERFGAERAFYSPLDFPWAVRAHLKALRPRMLVLAETEFWPNLLAGCFRRGIPVAVVNARISDRSWPRYRRLRRLWQPILSKLSRVLAQTDTDAERLRVIGCRPERVTVAGNLKFDVRVAGESAATQLLQSGAQGLRFIVAGSTLEGEESTLLEAWPRLLSIDARLVLVIAPRHPERFGAVDALLERSECKWIRRSEWPADSAGSARGPEPGEIVLLDTIGELASAYALASIAFIGGSLVPAGGHNPLEPAHFGVPIVMGPYYANFRAIVEDLRAHDAIRIAQKNELAGTMIELLSDSIGAKGMGARARQVFAQQAGATERCVVALKDLLAVEALAEQAR
jgi:3-deoxy-D-manno-octulosonic-acid transferase